MTDFNPLEFGKVLGRLDAQDRTIAHLQNTMSVMNGKLDQLLEFQAKQRGAAAIGYALVTAISSVVAWAVATFFRP